MQPVMIGISIKRAYFDKGFCSVPVLKPLERRKIKDTLPMPVRGKSGGVRKLFESSANHKTTYIFKSPRHGELKVSAVVVKKYSKGRYKRKVRAGSLTLFRDYRSRSSHIRSLRCIVNDLGLKPVIAK
jgi:hypothetical protein